MNDPTDIEQGEDPGIPPRAMTCPTCANDQHEDCQVSHMGAAQAFCQCWCREVARQEEEEAARQEEEEARA